MSNKANSANPISITFSHLDCFLFIYLFIFLRILILIWRSIDAMLMAV